MKFLFSLFSQKNVFSRSVNIRGTHSAGRQDSGNVWWKN